MRVEAVAESSTELFCMRHFLLNVNNLQSYCLLPVTLFSFWFPPVVREFLPSVIF
jgi:hypothetical protein